MSKSLFASLVALGGVVLAVPSATAAPTSPVAPAPSASTLEKVHWSGGRYHCHRRNDDCHGSRYRRSDRYYGYYAPRYYYPSNRYGYYGSPGITLRFGSGRRYRDYRGW